MQTSKTFSIHFWLNLAKRKNDLAPIYARITVDGKRAEISLKRQTSVTYWDSKAKKTTQKSVSGKALNQYLDQVYSKLLLCHKQLTADFELITVDSIKNKFVGQNEQYKTLLDLIEYHDENMVVVLKKGTLKNYGATSKYLRKFLINKEKVKDIYLKHMSYRFILDFELYLRKSPSLHKNNPLSNNGIMKHLERFKKLMNLALDLEWIDKNPFSRYKLKFQKKEKEFLSQFELEIIENSEFDDSKLETVKDVFIFSLFVRFIFNTIFCIDKSC